MATTEPRYITTEPQGDLRFSVISLVASDEKYARLQASFEKAGFTPDNTEFLAVDNRSGNSFDGYRALRAGFAASRGEIVLYTHDDIELTTDGRDTLEAVIAGLDAADPNWMVAGNAGWTAGAASRLVRYLDDPHAPSRDIDAAVRVVSLDENFMFMPRARMVFPSLDLAGFHLFATDICLQARLAGGSAWVVPFALAHHSGGVPSQAYNDALAAFEAKYSDLHPGARMNTPAGPIFLGRTRALRRAVANATASATGRIRRVLGKLTKRNTGSPRWLAETECLA